MVNENENITSSGSSINPDAELAEQGRCVATSSLSIYYQNVRGLKTKVQEVHLASQISIYGIICFTETWIDKGVFDNELFSGRYNVFRADRKFQTLGLVRGGGVLCAIDKEYVTIDINLNEIILHIPSIDLLGLKIKAGQYTFILFVIYIPPNSSNLIYERLFELLVNLDSIQGYDIVFVGDFNLPDYAETNTTTTSVKLRALENFCKFYDFKQYNLEFNANERILDLVFSNVNSVQVVKSHISMLREDLHHPPLCIDLPLTKEGINNKFSVKNELVYNFKKADYITMYNLFMETDWSFLSVYEDANLAVEEFYGVINNIFLKCVPMTHPKCHKYPPWYNKDIIYAIKKKFSVWKQYKQFNNPRDLEKFKNMRSNIKRDIKVAHRQYVSNIENNLKANPKSFWSYINSKKNTSTIPESMIFENTSIDDPQEIVNAFGTFFKSAFNISSEYLAPDVDDINENELQLVELSEDNIYKALRKLKNKFTTGPDGIPSFLVRDCANIFAKPLCILFNISLKSNTFPDLWKCSKIIPVYKKDSRTDITNYRPITIINNFSKAFELALYQEFYVHVNEQICANQHGFVAGRSTVSNLVCVTQFISEVLDDNGQVDVIYTDFSKAFDRLDHGILLRKLSDFGFNRNLVNFIFSYLKNRKQCVQYHGYKSDEITASSGVPQGSVLGPLFFVLFINDIVLDLNCHCLLYADDLKLYLAINDEMDCLLLQEDLNVINTWCTSNCLPLNAAKCNAVTYTRKLKYLQYTYSIDGIDLNKPGSFKDLGITFDHKLTFTQHIDIITSSAYKTMGFIIRNCHELNNINTLKMLFATFVRSKLEYGSVVWNPYYAVHSHAIEQIQRRYLKFMVFKEDKVYPPIGFPNDTLLERFGSCELSRRRFLHSVIFLHKLLKNKINCPDLLHKIQSYIRIPSVQTRLINFFYLPAPRTNLLKFSPVYVMCQNCHNIQDVIDIFNCSATDIKNCVLQLT